MSVRDSARAALERFREKYWKEGVVDVGVLESEAAKVGSVVQGDCAEQDGSGESEAVKELVGELERMAMDVENPVSDACALLWAYYWWEEDEDTAWEWWDRGLDMESPLMEAINLDNMEQEVGEDDWQGTEMPDQVGHDGGTNGREGEMNGHEGTEDDEEEDDWDGEFQAYDDETEAGG